MLRKLIILFKHLKILQLCTSLLSFELSTIELFRANSRHDLDFDFIITSYSKLK